MAYDYDLVVIGAGSAGLVSASAAVSLGAKVALIEREKMGGDCLNTGCVPSKSFLKAAHLANDISTAERFGLDTSLEVNMEQLMQRIKNVITAIEPHDSVERFEKLGVDVFLGEGKLLDAHNVKVGKNILNTKNIVLATGSTANIPPIKGLEKTSYRTNENIFDLKDLPEHLIILGGGPIGLELGQGFRHLGSNVSVIDRNIHLFKKEEDEVAPIMENAFLKDGMNLYLSSKIIELNAEGDKIKILIEKDGKKETLIGDELLVSLGRKPVIDNLGLEKLGIEMDQRGYILTNDKLQTNIKNIYACGDITGQYQFTHMAAYQAGIVIRNSIFHLGKKLDYSLVPWTTYTKPEVAHVGHTEKSAKKSGIFKKSIFVPLKENDRAISEGNNDGFLKLIVGKRGKLVGATLVSEKAGETIPIASLAIQQKLKPSAFLNLIFSYPTQAEIFQAASIEGLKDAIKPWHLKVIKALFLQK